MLRALEACMSKSISIVVLLSFLLLGGCQNNSINGNLSPGGSANSPSGSGPNAACSTATPACPSGDGTCAYLQWEESSAGDPTMGTILYNVYYGTSSGVYTTTINAITDMCYQVTAMDPGTYYFVVAAYNANGQSPYSNEGSKLIPLSLEQLQNNPLVKTSTEQAFVISGKPFNN